ncbi:hypothetical protein DFR52_102266 [Hoeflea marina]|uniref:Uncharacterized protein n=1 Tax=Hoeflea marina TaxID=274592 RepID=A0A317PM55_9HYPH|nr:hypothetical protein [Hoeflea marina]PWW01603.1 hypothetical protein DFR52_102266 [Hoeflea marina]
MTMKTWYRVGVETGALMVCAMMLAGCMGPTYGTDKTSTGQLIDDIGNIASIKPQTGPEIAYRPRPAIVQPPRGADLPAPQASVSENNPAWVEGPESTRQRLIAEAEANSNNPNYRSPLAARTSTGTDSGGRPLTVGRAADGPPLPGAVLSESKANAQFKENRKIQQGAYSDRRRYLSDPPLTYRAPAETAPVGVLGESERDKEKQRLAAATKKGTGKKWFWPF